MFIGFRVRKSLVVRLVSAVIEGALVGTVCNFLFPSSDDLLLAPAATAAALVVFVLVVDWFERWGRRTDR